MSIKYIVVILIAVTLVSCTIKSQDDINVSFVKGINKQDDEYASSLNEAPQFAIEAETTTAGGRSEEYNIDGKASLKATGTPFTQEEIQSQINVWLENGLLQFELGDGCEIATKGYYSISLEYGNSINYNFLDLPVFRNDELVGEITISRDGYKEVNSGMGGAYSTLCSLLAEYPDSEFVMLYGASSKAAIGPDNKIHILSGRDSFNVINSDTLYDTFKTHDNTLSRNIERVPVDMENDIAIPKN
jgi:hypothetical protein